MQAAPDKNMSSFHSQRIVYSTTYGCKPTALGGGGGGGGGSGRMPPRKILKFKYSEIVNQTFHTNLI